MFSATLHAAEVTSTTVTLTWTATADNGPFSTKAAYYDLRYLEVPITIENWESAKKVTNLPVPQYSGNIETFKIMELTPDRIYSFAIKVGDESGNWSILSNIAMVRTASPPICGDLDESGEIDIADLVALVDYMFRDGVPKFNLMASDFDSSGAIDISDLIAIVEYMFRDGQKLECPY